MNNLIKNILYFLLLFSFSNCDNTGKLDNENFLEFYYLEPGINSPFNYSCEMISKRVFEDKINYKKIVTANSVKRFMSMYEAYKISPDTSNGDIRIKVIIHQREKIDTLCLGENFRTYKNGIKVYDNQELLKYLKTLIDYENTVPSFVRNHPDKHHDYKHGNKMKS